MCSGSGGCFQGEPLRKGRLTMAPAAPVQTNDKETKLELRAQCCLWPVKPWGSQWQSYKAAGSGKSRLHPCYQTRSNPRGFRDLLFYLYQCNTSEEHSELGGGICITWAQPGVVGSGKQNLTRRQGTTDSHNGSCLCLCLCLLCQDYLAL